MLGKLNIVKMTTFPKLLCRLNKILILQILLLKCMCLKIDYQKKNTEVMIVVSNYQLLICYKIFIFLKRYGIS